MEDETGRALGLNAFGKWFYKLISGNESADMSEVLHTRIKNVRLPPFSFAYAAQATTLVS